MRTASSRRIAFGPAFTFPRTDGVRGYNDITPRMGALVRPVRQRQDGAQGEHQQVPAGAVQRRRLHHQQPGGDAGARRPAAVVDRRTEATHRDFVADCDFLNPGTNGECRAWTNLNWGQQGQTTHGQSRRAGGLGQAQLGLAVQRRRPARDRCRACRSTSATAAGGGATSSSRRTARSAARTTTR